MKHILIIAADAKTLIYHRGALLQRLAGLGVKITAVASEKEDYEHVRQFVRKLGGDYRTVPMARTSLNPLKDLVTLVSLWKLCRSVRPDAVFSYTIKPVVYGSVAAWLAGVERIFALVPGLGYAFTPDGTAKQKIVSLATRFLYSIALRCCHLVFLQNRDDESLLREKKILSRRVPSHVTMGSGVNLDEFGFTPVPAVEAGHLEFVLVARLLKNKGILEYVEAARRLRVEWPGLKFHIVGPSDPSPDGVSASEIESWSDGESVIYHGSIRDVCSVLQSCHVFVLPTYYREGVPRSTLEALSIGRPVITTDVVGARETITLTDRGQAARERLEPVMEGENGFLIRPKDVDALCSSMKELIQNPERASAMGQRGRELAESTFDVNEVNAGIVKHLLHAGKFSQLRKSNIEPALTSQL
ncbi:MAG: glycosyltransferase involved in cell wall biosynthesis [Verrucomicrobiales bacterium]|jgi:glycosyltransferase involved in cell wall biosynthesis